MNGGTGLSDEEERAVWIANVGRTVSYVQSNAAIQIQLFGFFVSAAGLSIALARPDVRHFVVYWFLPLSAFILLVISSIFFKFYCYQSVFIYLHGTRFERGTVRSHEDFFDTALPDVSASEVAAALFSERSMPYSVVLTSYILSPPLLIALFQSVADTGFLGSEGARMGPGWMLAYVAIAFATMQRLSRPGWAALKLEEQEKRRRRGPARP